MNTQRQLRTRAAIAAAVTATCLTIGVSRGAVQTYSSVVFAPNTGADHPGFGFYQADFAWDDGLSGEFEFAGSDGAFQMACYAFGGGGVTGRANDHAAYFSMDYNPNPPTRSFGSFWFGGVGNDIGPLPSTSYGQVLAYADVLTPLGTPFEFRTESDYNGQGNGFKFAGIGAGTWQTVGGVVSGATFFGNINVNDPQLASLVAFGQNGNEISAVDSGPQTPWMRVDNLTLTIAAASWNSTGGGNWSDNSKWSPVAPDGANATATFGNTVTAPSTITVDGQRFAGQLQINSGQSYTFAGTGSASLNIRVVGAGTNGIVTVGDLGSHTISAPLELWNNTTVNVLLAGSSLSVTNVLDVHDGATVTKSGAGTFNVPNVRATGLIVNGGTVHVLANGNDAGTSKVGTLSIDAGASLDLHDNDLVVVGGNATAIGALVAQARNGGAWNAPGLTSSAARANATTGLGVLTGAEYNSVGGTGSFSGQSYGSGDVLVKYTWNGDANFDGRVTFDDYVKIDTGFNTHLTGWLNGDFNYSGAVNFDDYVLIDIAFNQQNGTLSRAVDWISGDDRSGSDRAAIGVSEVIDHLNQFGSAYGAAFLAAVPEPTAAVGLVAFCSANALRRRPRRHRSG